jgi:hypothetical protein
MSISAAVQRVIEQWDDQRYRTEVGKVVSFTPPTAVSEPKVTVQLQILDREGNRLPPIGNVPVVYPRSSMYSIYFPLEVGDQVLCLFARDVDAWKQLGGFQAFDGSTDGTLSNCIAIPGGYPFGEPIPGVLTNKMVMGYHSATPGSERYITINSSGFRIGSWSYDLLTILDDLLEQLKVATAGGFPLDPATLTKLTNLTTQLAVIKQ